MKIFGRVIGFDREYETCLVCRGYSWPLKKTIKTLIAEEVIESYDFSYDEVSALAA